MATQLGPSKVAMRQLSVNVLEHYLKVPIPSSAARPVIRMNVIIKHIGLKKWVCLILPRVPILILTALEAYRTRNKWTGY